MPQENQGSLPTALAGDYDFSISDVLNEAWAATNGIKLAMHIALSIYTLVYLAIAGPVFYILGGEWALFTDFQDAESYMQRIADDWRVTVASAAGTIICAPLMAGLMMMAVRHVQGRHVSSSMIGMCLAGAAPLLACCAMRLAGSWIGSMLFILPGIYISIAWSFALLLVAEKNLPVWEALEASRKAVTHHWFKVFFTFFGAGLIVSISMLPLGLGLIWTLPMMFTLYAVLYRRIFGLSKTFDA